MPVVEFILRLKDMLSGGAQNAATNATRSFSRIESGARGVSRSIGNLPAAARRAGERSAASIAVLERALKRLEYRRSITVDSSQLSRVNRDIQRTENELKRLKNLGVDDGGGTKKGGFLSFLGGARGIAAGVGITALLAGAGSITSMGMQAGAQKTSFQAMAGDQAGGQLFSDLTKFANDSIFGKEVYQNSQTMLAFGESVKDVMPDLKMLGDISMGNKERLGSLSLAFSQIQATGRLMGQDLLQLVNAGFNPLQTISEKTGISMGDLKQKMEDGQISFAMVKKAFQDATGPGGRFFDMTNRISETPFGKWEALKGQISGIGVEFGTALLPMASSLMDAFKPIVDMLPAAIARIVPSIQNFTKDFLPALVTIAHVLVDVIPSAFRLIANTAGVLIKILNPFIIVLGFIASSLGRLFDGMADAAASVSEKITNITDRMMGNVASTITDNKSNVVDAMSGVINGGEMDALFQEAGKKHGQLYAQELQDRVSAITLTMPQQEVLATWATRDGKPIVKEGSTDPYGDYLEKPQSAQEVLDQLPALLRQTGLKKGRADFDKLANTYLNAKESPFLSKNDAAAIRNGAAKIVEEQRAYLTKLANGDIAAPAKGSGYEFTEGKKKKKKGKGLSAKGVTHAGPKVITVNFNKEFIGKFELNSLNVKEGVGEMEDMIQEAVYRIFYSLNSNQS